MDHTSSWNTSSLEKSVGGNAFFITTHVFSKEECDEMLQKNKEKYQQISYETLSRLIHEGRHSQGEIQKTMADLQKQYFRMKHRIIKNHKLEMYDPPAYMDVSPSSDMELNSTQTLKDYTLENDTAPFKHIATEILHIKADAHHRLRRYINKLHKLKTMELNGYQPDWNELKGSFNQVTQELQDEYINRREMVMAPYRRRGARRTFRPESDMDLYLHRYILPELDKQQELYYEKRMKKESFKMGSIRENSNSSKTRLPATPEDRIWPLDDIPQIAYFKVKERIPERARVLNALYIADVQNIWDNYSDREDYPRILALLRGYYNNLLDVMSGKENHPAKFLTQSGIDPQSSFYSNSTSNRHLGPRVSASIVGYNSKQPQSRRFSRLSMTRMY